MIAHGSTLPAALKACSRSKDLQRGREFHYQAVQTGQLFTNKYVASSVINMYAKCGDMQQAQAVFHCLTQVKAESLCAASCNALLQGYVDNGETELAVETFQCMETSGCLPNARTFVVMLSACATLAAEKGGRSVRRWLEKGQYFHSRAAQLRCCNDIFVQNTLLDMYGKCGSVSQAQAVFDSMPQKDVVSWTALMMGYVENGKHTKALELFQKLDCKPDARIFVAALTALVRSAAEEREKLTGTKNSPKLSMLFAKGKAIHAQVVSYRCCDIFILSTLIDLYGKCRCMSTAQLVFEELRSPNRVSWTALIMGYIDNEENGRALQLIAHMDLSGVGQDSQTFVAALTACSNLAAVQIGRELHAEVVRRSLEQNVLVANSLVDFYGKCREMKSAKLVFDGIKDKTVVSWNSLMCGYSLSGDTGRVFEVLEEMRKTGVQANGATFVCVLTACSHAGLTERGKDYFTLMESEYGVKPSMKHYGCVVDLLGRANCLDEALKFITSMPFEPDAVMWNTLLGACFKSNNHVVAESVQKNFRGYSQAVRDCFAL